MRGSGERRVDAGAPGTLPPGTLTALLQRIAGEEPAAGAPEERPFEPGAVVGRFEIVRELGRGGFGVVYEARDRELGRSVALKAVFAGAREELRKERLWREAEAAARLSHPNIVALHDAGHSERGPYLVLELLQGRTVAQRLREGPLATAEAVHVAVEVAKGVAHAHGQGVVHRDLKPGNVFLCEDGQVKVLDFGLAHAFGRRRHDGGTPAYMAPEQREGAPEDERTDVWALGAILFEMLSGRLPFEEGKRARGAPALEVPGEPALGDLVGRMLAPRPVDRPRDGAEVLKALAAVEHQLQPGTPGAGRVRVRRRRVLKLVALTVASVAVGAGVAWLVVGRGPAAGTAPPSVAVLPFADMSPGKDQEHFSDGIAEEILSALSHVEGLNVAGRTSSFSFKGKSVQLHEIGRQLNVAAVLEGSVRREGDRVRVTAQLVNVVSGYHLWSETYDRELTGIFAVQDDIARAVVEALKVKLVPGRGPGTQGRTTNPESYNYYLLGLHHFGQKTLEGALRSRAAFEKALELDPGNARAQAALAMAIVDIWEFSTSTTAAENEDLSRRSMAAAERAVAMAPSLADGYAARGWMRLYFLDWAGSRADLERALALAPNDPKTLVAYSLLQSAFGKVTEGIALSKRAAELDPLSSEAWGRLSCLYLARGELSMAGSAIDHWLEVTPEFRLAWSHRMELHLLQGQPAAALSAARRIADQNDPYHLLGVALAEHDLGHVAESDRALEKLISRWGHGNQYQIAQAYAWRGDADRAFEWLERAWRERDVGVNFVKFDSLLPKIRGDPRYAALLRTMNLPVD